MAHEALDPTFLDLIDLDAPVRQLGTGFIFTEGPIWHPVEHHLLFSDLPGDVRRRWDNGGVSEVQRPSNKGNGMTYDVDLNLLVCEHSTSSVVRIRPNGSSEALCTHFEGKELNSPNDIVVHNNGSIYFTDPTYGRNEHFGVPRDTQLGFQGVFRLPPNHRPGDEPELVSDRYMFSQPNGLCFSPCYSWMWVNDTVQASIRMFDVADDGGLTNSRTFASGIRDSVKRGSPDGMKTDEKGNVWVTAPGGVWVYSFHGKLIGKIVVPEMVANLHWGGPDWKTLFLCAETSLYAIDTKVLPKREPFMEGSPTAPAPFHSAPPVAKANNHTIIQTESGSMRIEAHKSVLIIQDMQNDVMIDGGAFAHTGSPQHAKDQNVIANIRRLAEACRSAGVLVVFVWLVAEPGHPAMGENAPLLKGLKENNALVRGTWGVQPAAGLEPQHGDLIVEKITMSAWESGRLENYIKGAGRHTIINTGSWTNMSVEHTARTGADKGYNIIVPEDACSTMNADWHNASTQFALQEVSVVTSVDEVISALR